MKNRYHKICYILQKCGNNSVCIECMGISLEKGIIILSDKNSFLDKNIL